MLNQVICTRIPTYYSLVFLTQMRKENLCGKKISQVSMYVSLFTLALIGDSQFLTASNILRWTICWIKHGRQMILVLVTCLILRVYYLMRCTHSALWWVIMNSFDSTILHFWLWFLFIARFARFVLLGGIYTFSALHRLCCLSETWVARVPKVTVMPDCLVCRDAGMIKFYLYIALLCSQWVENVNPLLEYVHAVTIDP
jgi:hypothetical protein